MLVSSGDDDIGGGSGEEFEEEVWARARVFLRGFVRCWCARASIAQWCGLRSNCITVVIIIISCIAPLKECKGCGLPMAECGECGKGCCFNKVGGLV